MSADLFKRAGLFVAFILAADIGVGKYPSVWLCHSHALCLFRASFSS